VSGRVAPVAENTKRGQPRFKSGKQWEVLRREEGAVIVGKDGVEKRLPLDVFSLFNVQTSTCGRFLARVLRSASLRHSSAP